MLSCAWGTTYLTWVLASEVFQAFCLFHVLPLVWGTQESEEHVSRRDQLKMAPPGRGRGRGRGRGTPAKEGQTGEHRKESRKRKKAKEVDTEEYEDFWTEDMLQEWAKWKYEGCWYNEHQEDAENMTVQDEAPKNFDRYAHLAGKEAMHDLGAHAASKISSTEQDANKKSKSNKNEDNLASKKVKKAKSKHDDPAEEKLKKKTKT